MTIQTNIDGLIKDIKEVNVFKDGVTRNFYAGVTNENGLIREVFTNDNIVDSIKLTTHVVQKDFYDIDIHPYPADLIINNQLRQLSIQSLNVKSEQLRVGVQMTFYDKFGNELTSNTLPTDMSIEFTGSLYCSYLQGYPFELSYFNVYGYDIEGSLVPLYRTPNHDYFFPIALPVLSSQILTFNTSKSNTRFYMTLRSMFNSNMSMRLTINEFLIKKKGVIIKRIVPIFDLTNNI